MNELLKSADPDLSDEDIDRAVGLLWVNAFACSNGGGQVPTVYGCGDHKVPLDDQPQKLRLSLNCAPLNDSYNIFGTPAILPTFSFTSHS